MRAEKWILKIPSADVLPGRAGTRQKFGAAGAMTGRSRDFIW
jgi:hypothetical protein